MITTGTPLRTTHSTFQVHTISPARRTVLGLHLFHALSAVGGGIALVAGALPVPLAVLRHTPFDSFVVPGIFLGTVIGGSALIGARALLAGSRRALVASAAAGAIMVGWILGETVLVEGFSWLQGLYLVTGSIVVLASIRSWRAAARAPDPAPIALSSQDAGGAR